MTSDMPNNQKKIIKGNYSVDRISSLPDHVIECIMNFMSTRDAARTCMLSTRWRYVWAHHPSLVLDSVFWKDIKKSNKDYSKLFEDYSNIVRKILKHHVGYIRTSVLQGAPTFLVEDVDSWLLSLCSGGLKELTVENSGYLPYRVPCSVNSSSDLIKLHLSGCIIGSGCFTNITTLSLVDVDFRLDVKSGSDVVLLTTPLLTYLRIKSDNILCIDISAPRLKSLSLCTKDGLRLEPFLKCTGIEYASILYDDKIVRGRPTTDIYRCESFCLVKLVAAWPMLSELEMDGCCLEYLTAGIEPCQLGQLSLRSFKIDCRRLSWEWMPWIFCILKNSPLLQTFYIRFSFYWMPNIDESRISLDRLHTVTLTKITYTTRLAKFLLRCAPVLKIMLVEKSEKVSAKLLKKLSTLQLEFPKTRIVYRPYVEEDEDE